MKITKIEVIPNTEIQLGDLKLSGVIITCETFWNWTDTQFKAFPTSYGPTYGSGFIHFYIYVNKLGKQLENKVSQQINDFFRIPENQR